MHRAAGRLGRRLHRRHEPDDEVPLRRRRRSPSTRPTRSTRPRRARRWRRSARASAPPASSRSRTSAPGARYRSTVDSWLPYVSGGMEEQFGKWGTDPATGYVTGNGWQRQLDALKNAQAAGQAVHRDLALAADDATAARYGWASVLLGAAGKRRLRARRGLHERDLVPRVRLRPRRARAAPRQPRPAASTAACSSAGSCSSTRRPQRSPCASAAPTPAPGLTAATGATLAPNSALILTRDGAAPSDPAPSARPATGGASERPDGARTSRSARARWASCRAAGACRGRRPGGRRLERQAAAPRGVRVKVRCRSHSARLPRPRDRAPARRARRPRLVKVRAGRAKTVSVRLNRRGRAALAAKPKSLRVVVSRAR